MGIEYNPDEKFDIIVLEENTGTPIL
jgi:hypothetical protein